MQLIAAALALLSVVQATPSYTPQSLSDARRTRSVNLPRAACKAPNYTPAPVDDALPAFDPVKAVIFRNRKQQSVNVGNLFAHEAWMGTSTYACATGPKTAEIDIARGTNAKAILEHQWDTFVTEDDFAYLQKVGINTIRLPIGFWTLGPDFVKGSIFEQYGATYTGSWPRVKRLIGWAGKYGIGVLVDMHGAYGSQNGQAHSGVSDGKTNLFSSKTDQALTITALEYITQEMMNVTNVVGIQILNEPKNDPALWPFYTTAIEAMRKVDPTMPLYIHDAFNIKTGAEFVGKRDDFTVVDHHSYFVFQGQYQSMPVTGLTDVISSSVSSTIGSSTKTARGNLVTDEWGCALADGSTKVSNLNSATAKYCQTQESVYRQNAAGYAFWSYNLDGCSKGDGDGWCFKGSVGNNLPATFFSYEGQTTPSDFVVDGTAASNSTDVGAQSADDTSSTSSAAVSTSTASSSSAKSSACAVKKRKRAQNAHRRHHAKRASSSSSSSPGYTKGMDTAKTFQAAGGSKLGFVIQYCKDVIGSACTDSYLADFQKGVTDGEASLGKRWLSTTE